MSESVSILEGGIARKFYPVKKLRTSNGDGYDNWVPESEVETTSLSVTERGVYYPSTDGVYGYDEVDIDLEVADYTDGLEDDPDTGKPKKEKITTEKDPETGDDVLVVTELPSSIQITTLPTTVNYVDGQAISIEGIVVHAYHADGRDWGVVPFEELSFVPKIAKLGDDEIDGSGVPLHNPSSYHFPVQYAKGSIDYVKDDGSTINISGGYEAFFVGVNDNGTADILAQAAVSLNPFAIVKTKTDSRGKVTTKTYDAQQVTTLSGETTGYVVTSGFSGEVGYTPVGVPTNLFTGATANTADFVAIYYEGVHTSSSQTVTVSWLPPDGVEALTDTYDITIGQGPIPQ